MLLVFSIYSYKSHNTLLPYYLNVSVINTVYTLPAPTLGLGFKTENKPPKNSLVLQNTSFHIKSTIMV